MLAKPTRKPEWLKVKAPGGENYARLKATFRSLNLHTVCEEASCPNIGECWGGGTATLMLMGDTCTRACKFCHVKSGNPKGVLDIHEPEKVATSLSQMDLTYVVLTSVDRDDLPDGGADHFARTVEAIKRLSPNMLVEVLIPDFKAERDPLIRISQCGADVIAHNIETIERLTKTVRDVRATYPQSLEVLRRLKFDLGVKYTKSSIMVGLGETQEEVLKAMDELREVDCDILTVGQYLRPTNWHLEVGEYLTPEIFKFYEDEGLKRGFKFVPSGPLVRSSYKAGEKFIEAMLRGERASAH